MRKRLPTFLKRPCQTPIPPLPDDVILEICKYLSPKDLLSIRRVCKRFKDLELAIGGRVFDDVGVIMYPDRVAIVPKLMSKNCYCFETNGKEDLEEKFPDISKFFLGATADTMSFNVMKDCVPNPSPGFLSLLNLIGAKEIFLYLYCETDFSGFIASFFETFENGYLKGVTFIWNSLKYQNLERLQEAMTQLPILDSVCLFEDNETISDDDFLLNGQMMLSMIKTAPDILLKCIDCTTEDLMDAFEMICDSAVHKDVILYVIRSATDDLITMAEQEGFMVCDNSVLDYPRGYEMKIPPDTKKTKSDRYRLVSIRPISESEMESWKTFLVDIGQGTDWNPLFLNQLFAKVVQNRKKRGIRRICLWFRRLVRRII